MLRSATGSSFFSDLNVVIHSTDSCEDWSSIARDSTVSLYLFLNYMSLVWKNRHLSVFFCSAFCRTFMVSVLTVSMQNNYFLTTKHRQLFFLGSLTQGCRSCDMLCSVSGRTFLSCCMNTKYWVQGNNKMKKHSPSALPWLIFPGKTGFSQHTVNEYGVTVAGNCYVNVSLASALHSLYSLVQFLHQALLADVENFLFYPNHS